MSTFKHASTQVTTTHSSVVPLHSPRVHDCDIVTIPRKHSAHHRPNGTSTKDPNPLLGKLAARKRVGCLCCMCEASKQLAVGESCELQNRRQGRLLVFINSPVIRVAWVLCMVEGSGVEAEMERAGSAGEPGGGSREPLTGALPRIDIAKDRFPYCLVWSPLPLIS